MQTGVLDAQMRALRTIVEDFIKRRDKVAADYAKQAAAVSQAVKTRPNDPKTKQMVALLAKVAKSIQDRENKMRSILAANRALDKAKSTVSTVMQKGADMLKNALSFVRMGAVPVVAVPVTYLIIGGLSLVVLTALAVWIRKEGNATIINDISDLETIQKIRASLPVAEQKKMDEELNLMVKRAAEEGKKQGSDLSLGSAVSSGFTMVAGVAALLLILNAKK